MNNRRIDLLDSFRFLAVGSVLLYHFTFEWKARVPYGNYFGDLFQFGYFGVAFFFIISGFVISYTLESTSSLSFFWKHRFIRLFPALILCSLLTYAAAAILDNGRLSPVTVLPPNVPIFPNAHKISNFLPTLTLTNPNIWNSLNHLAGNPFPGIRFAWINGSYWSLWVEIQFYLLASALYFWNKKNFFRNILLATIVGSIAKDIPPFLLNGRWRDGFSQGLVDFLSGWNYTNAVFNIDYFILWFTLGIIFHYLYKWRHAREDLPVGNSPARGKSIPLSGKSPFAGVHPLTILLLAIVLVEFCLDRVYGPGVLHFLMPGLFLLMIYKKKYLFFLDNALFRRIGVISYSVYLIHEVAGVLLIHTYGGLLGKWSPLAPFIMLVFVLLFAELSYRFYEKKISIYLKTILKVP